MSTLEIVLTFFSTLTLIGSVIVLIIESSLKTYLI